MQEWLFNCADYLAGQKQGAGSILNHYIILIEGSWTQAFASISRLWKPAVAETRLLFTNDSKGSFICQSHRQDCTYRGL